MTRRGVLQTGAGLALGSVLAAGESDSAAPPASPDVYASLGVKPVINAIGTVTFLGGSLMPPEVVAAWIGASRHFVNLQDLQDRVGERIAKAVGVEAALVTTGAAGALLLGTAAAVTRGEAAFVKRLPDTQGMKNEVILQKAHHSCYDNQLTDVGVKLIDVETPADVRRAVNERTALLFFMNVAEDEGRIKRGEWIELARRHQVPSLLDAAADVPPVEHLSEYNRAGFDLVTFSGGKALRGPNNTGLLLGKKELIEAANRNANPHCGTIGRMMKVGKEDMVALLAAVERVCPPRSQGRMARVGAAHRGHRRSRQGHSHAGTSADRAADRQPCSASATFVGREAGEAHPGAHHQGFGRRRPADPHRPRAWHRRQGDSDFRADAAAGRGADRGGSP